MPVSRLMQDMGVFEKATFSYIKYIHGITIGKLEWKKRTMFTNKCESSLVSRNKCESSLVSRNKCESFLVSRNCRSNL